MNIKCANGRNLLVTSRGNVRNDLVKDCIPGVVMLTAWKIEQSSVDYWASIIKFLLARGCTYFVCSGDYSEELHDELDEFLYQCDTENNLDISTNIITTFHKNETAEDIATFFIYGTELKEMKGNCLVAILFEEMKEDQDLLEALKKN